MEIREAVNKVGGQREIQFQLELGKKSEQQALAKYGLDFVTDTYLPEKLAEMGII